MCRMHTRGHFVWFYPKPKIPPLLLRDRIPSAQQAPLWFGRSHCGKRTKQTKYQCCGVMWIFKEPPVPTFEIFRNQRTTGSYSLLKTENQKTVNITLHSLWL
jgi:hypothetical protein